MDVRYCEVIGCTQTATWRRTIETDVPLEDFLCDRCQHQLCVEYPKYVACYSANRTAPAHSAALAQLPLRRDNGDPVARFEKKEAPGAGRASQDAPIRVLIVDDHPMMRAGLSAVIARSPGMCLVGEASDGREAVRLYKQHKPNLVLMDVRMPVMDGLQATRTIRAEFPSARIVVFSICMGDETIYQALQAGASGYLLKEVPSSVVLEAIRAVLEGRIVLPAEVAGKLTEHLALQELTAREREVLAYIVAGKSNSEIGELLFICEGTVKSHVNRILTKLRVTDRTQAAITAIKRGFAYLN